MIILGDIGGTKSQFSLLSNQRFPGEFVRFDNRNFDSFDALINELASHLSSPVSACLLAVAGPVKNNHCEMTNLNWTLNQARLEQHFPDAKIQLINDLEATAWAIPYLNAEDLTFLQGEQLHPTENLSIMSIGKGMGQATLTWQRQTGYQAIAGEGGHCDFAPHTECEAQLLHFLWQQKRRQNNPLPVSLEQVVSGQGLHLILEFLTTTNQELIETRQELIDKSSGQNPLADEPPDPSEDINAEIIRLAHAFPLSIYRSTVDLFCDLIANELGNMALRTLSHGGAVLAGGMVLQLLPFINQTHFAARFANKDAFAALLQTIPIAVCTNTQAPLAGLYHHWVESLL